MRAVVTAFSFLAMMIAVPASALAACDRACLTKATDTYLDALRANRPGGAGLASSAVLVENGKRVSPGQGLWVQGVQLRSRQIFVDPINQQVAFYGAALIDGKLNSYFERLKFAGGRIVETETFSKGGEPGTPSDATVLLEPDVLYDAPVPTPRRRSREALMQIVTSYMQGLGRHDPSGIPFHARCDRYSAGSKFTNNLDLHSIEKGGGTCAQSLMRLSGQATEDGRISLIDEALGIVVAEFIIPHGERPQRAGTNVAEIFKIVDGKVRSIEEFAFSGPYPVSSGFGPAR